MLGLLRRDGSEFDNAEKKSKLSEAYFESLTASVAPIADDWQTGPVATAMAIDDVPHAQGVYGTPCDMYVHALTYI